MKQPSIVLENENWALLFKPHGIPSAPLRGNDENTLLNWYLRSSIEACKVVGKKKIEHGLIHRLDTGTEGLVLVAKNQLSYDTLCASQSNGLIKKTYMAFCDSTGINPSKKEIQLPFRIASRFRPYGPKGREVRPLFPGMKGYDLYKTEYETIVETVKKVTESGSYRITCTLVRGYRHQIRAHLAYLGFPIIGDPLYNQIQTIEGDVPLQLYAPEITFPDPLSGLQVFFSLPIPDKMIP